MDIPRRLSFITPPRILSIDQHSLASRFYRSRVHRGLNNRWDGSSRGKREYASRTRVTCGREGAGAFRLSSRCRRNKRADTSGQCTETKFHRLSGKNDSVFTPRVTLSRLSSSNLSNLSRRAPETAESEKSFIIPRINFPARIITEQRLLKRNGCCI